MLFLSHDFDILASYFVQSFSIWFCLMYSHDEAMIMGLVEQYDTDMSFTSPDLKGYKLSTSVITNNVNVDHFNNKVVPSARLLHQNFVQSVSHLCPTFCDPMDCNLPGSSFYGIFLSKDTGVGCHFLFQSTDQISVSHIGRRFFTTAPPKLLFLLSMLYF